jgi:pimeloyl-ACP methyl ester carboxylesterase
VGASERIFSRLSPKQAEIVPLKWLRPERREDIHSYARRLAVQIDTSRPFWLLGVSFGGMVAIELSRFLAPDRIVLVSSVKNRAELPWYGRFLGTLGAQRLVAMPLARFFVAPGSYLLGIETEEDYQLVDRSGFNVES